MQTSSKTAISAILLIAGTCMGAGMLALPVVTGPSGFWPALAINLLCWLYMVATGFLYLEATLWMHEGANVLSMAKRFLGRYGEILCGASFIFLYYSLQVSYISGGAPLLSSLIGIEHFSHRIECLLFSSLFGFLVFLGTHFIDRLNWVLMTAAILSFALLITLGSSEVQLPLLQRQEWPLMFFAVPTLFGAFGFHNIVPTLTFYMQRNRNKMRLAIFGGTLIPFIIYALWQWMVIGSLSLENIESVERLGIPITLILQDITGNIWINSLGRFFGFFAIVTSLLGVSLSMVDFIGDGLNFKRTGWDRFILVLLVFIPPAIFAGTYPGVFNTAIGIAGGYGEALLNGLFPIALVWTGRYVFQLKTVRELPGGKPVLLFFVLITLIIIGLETYILLG